LNAYDISGWGNFLVAEVGAAAALSGLIFVAVSINLSKILAAPNLPRRAGQAIAMLMAVLVAATLLLVPGQSSDAMGWEILSVGLAALALPTVMQLVRLWGRGEKVAGRVIVNGLVSQLPTLPFVVAGLSLLVRAGGGLYWLVPAVVGSFIAGTLYGWVLLVEILR
jgi:modulator of FtsH protease